MGNPHPLHKNQTKTSSPIFVIGLDGGTFDIIKPMIDQGELPNLARLMNMGTWGPLQSTEPPISPQAWSSFLTGVHPGHHGIFGFLGSPHGRFYRRPILSARHIQMPTLLQIVGETGQKVAALGIPLTYPPYPVNGVIVPEQHGHPLSYPPHLWDELVAAVGDPRDQASHISYLFTQDKRGYVKLQRKLLEIQYQAAHWLLDQESYDLFIVVFTATDRMSHFLWKYMDPAHPDHRPEWAEALGDALPDLYRRLDTIIGELWTRLGSDGTIIVMSDHGFGPLHKRIYINRWLWEQGLLTIQPIIYRLASIRYPWPILRMFNSAARRLGLPYQALPIGHWQEPIDPNLYDPRFFFDAHLLIDWSRTRVYSGNSAEQGLFINLRGREPCGIVNPGAEYERLRQELRQELDAMADPDTGNPIVERVWLREELYSGPFIERIPDLVIRTRDHLYNLSPEIFTPQTVHPSLHVSGVHRPEGICIMAGPPIQANGTLNNASIVDLAPTILRLMNIPLPSYMDGHVLQEALLATCQTPMKERYTHIPDKVNSDTSSDLSDDEIAAIEAHLRGLGYIG
jgi:predicted AlkP superfamily phosphohydrolase/phosphomutase